MRTPTLALLALALLAGPAAAATIDDVPLRGLSTTHYIEVPEDLGPAAIDVSGYPAEYQATYRDIFLRVYSLRRGGPAREINSPLLELDPRGEAALRREQPELFAAPGLIAVGRHAWRDEVMKIKSTPCCSACPRLSMDEAKALWRFLAYDSIRRKTGANAQAWAAHRRTLLEEFAKRRPNT